jgi:diguanylate cyclase (GGDEF)-like protein
MNLTSELKKAKDKLELLSITDGLSGLYNYRHLLHSLESELRRAIRYRRSLALLLMDIDYFKNLNDTNGHLFGDYVIKTVGELLKSNVRATDIVARYGDDELAVMLIETNTKSALDVAEKLKQEIGNHTFQWQVQQLSVNQSIGLAKAPAPGIQEVSDLIQSADRDVSSEESRKERRCCLWSGRKSRHDKSGKRRLCHTPTKMSKCTSVHS